MRLTSGGPRPGGRATADIGRHSLGTKDRSEAIDRLRGLDRKTAIRLGIVAPADASEEPEILPIADGIATYRKWVARPTVTGGATKATQKRYKAVFDKFSAFAQREGITSWQEVTTQVLVRYAGWLDDEGYSYATEYLEMTTLKQAMNTMRDTFGVRGLPQIDLQLAKPSGTTTYCYTAAEFNAIFMFCMADPRLVWLGRVVAALAHTGLRISELADLRWSDIDDEDGWISLPDRSRQGTREQRRTARSNKGKLQRQFPIHQDLARVLADIRRHPDGRIFHGSMGGRLKPDTVRNVLVRDVLTPLRSRFGRVGSEPSFEDGRVHSFKHFFVSRCADDGVPEQVVKQWLWCGDSKMIRRYYHPDRVVAERHMNKVKFLVDDGEAA